MLTCRVIPCLDVRDGQVKDYRYKLIPVLADAVSPDPEVAQQIRRVRQPHERMLGEVIGRTETVSGFMPSNLRSYMSRHYRTGDIVLAAAGNIAHGDVVAMAREGLAGLPAGPRERRRNEKQVRFDGESGRGDWRGIGHRRGRGDPGSCHWTVVVEWVPDCR